MLMGVPRRGGGRAGHRSHQHAHVRLTPRRRRPTCCRRSPRSYDYGAAALGGIRRRRAAGARSRARRSCSGRHACGLVYFVIGHAWDIYGQMAVYLRLNGIVPAGEPRRACSFPCSFDPSGRTITSRSASSTIRAFGQPDEGAIVAAVRRCGAPFRLARGGPTPISSSATSCSRPSRWAPAAGQRPLRGSVPMAGAAVAPAARHRRPARPRRPGGVPGGRIPCGGRRRPPCLLPALRVRARPGPRPRLGPRRAGTMPSWCWALAPGGLRGCAGVVSYLPEFTPA